MSIAAAYPQKGKEQPETLALPKPGAMRKTVRFVSWVLTGSGTVSDG